MAASDLESRYLESCRKHDVEPNSSILLGLSKMKLQKRSFQQSCLEINIDQLTCSDISPLMDILSTDSFSDIDAVDVLQRSSNAKVDEQHLLLLLSAVTQKLRVVDLISWLSWRDVVRYICQVGITCQILKLCSSPIRKLSLTGKFLQLHTLILDFSICLTSFHINCFTSMPKLMLLSMCETRVANLWTTSAALSKLHSLVELRFQQCLCCCDLGRHVASENSINMEWAHNDDRNMLSPNYSGYTDNISMRQEDMQYLGADGTSTNMSSDDSFYTDHEFLSFFEESSDGSDLDFLESIEQTDNWRVPAPTELRPFLSPSHSTGLFSSPSSIQLFEEVIHSSSRLGCDICKANMIEDLESNCSYGHSAQCQLCIFSDHSRNLSGNELCSGSSTNLPNNRDTRDNLSTLDFVLQRHIFRHASPICFEKYYREYMITSLPNLKVLDGLPIRNIEREKAKLAYKKFFECIPYNRQPNDSVFRILQRKELGISQGKRKHSRESSHSLARSLSAAKLSSCPRPRLKPISKLQSSTGEEIKAFRPRQFEYHPVDQRLMVIGTLNGELFVVNHESMQLVGCLPSNGNLNSILGLCWLKKHPSKLIAGSDNGSLSMYDIRKMPPSLSGKQRIMGAPVVHSFADFDQLTSVHVNSTDDYFLASGFSRNVSLYDIGSGRHMQTFENLHDEDINVVKFSHHSPTLFASASFDKNIKLWDLRQGMSQPCYTTSSLRGNVMVCFSPDDHYLLASAVDNEVKQLHAVDGRCHMSFNIPSIGSGINYTRSYYMNGRDYIISGSCEEQIVRVCCAQTGRRLKDISLEGKSGNISMFVQSLRGDPFRDFHMSVLAACWNPLTRSEIVKINLLQSEVGAEESGFTRGTWASSGMGA